MTLSHRLHPGVSYDTSPVIANNRKERLDFRPLLLLISLRKANATSYFTELRGPCVRKKIKGNSINTPVIIQH